MDNFKVIYRILHYLEKAMDLDALDRSRLTPEALGVTEPALAGTVGNVGQSRICGRGTFTQSPNHAAWVGVFAGKRFDEKGGPACKGHSRNLIRNRQDDTVLWRPFFMLKKR